MFNYILTSHSLAMKIHEAGIKAKCFDASPETQQDHLMKLSGLKNYFLVQCSSNQTTELDLFCIRRKIMQCRFFLVYSKAAMTNMGRKLNRIYYIVFRFEVSACSLYTCIFSCDSAGFSGVASPSQDHCLVCAPQSFLNPGKMYTQESVLASFQ